MRAVNYSANTPLTLRSMSFREKEGRNGWQALKMTFLDEYDNRFSPMFFGPKTPKERVRINGAFRNLCIVLGMDYDLIPYQHSFEEFVYEYIKQMKDTFGTTIFVKTLPTEVKGKKFIRLGFEPPMFSLHANLSYTEEELLYIQGFEEEFEEIEKKKSKELENEEDIF